MSSGSGGANQGVDFAVFVSLVSLVSLAVSELQIVEAPEAQSWQFRSDLKSPSSSAICPLDIAPPNRFQASPFS
jgi:hypothetical protein